eukprot:327607-Lingulodinium_polyedra.AAC.1
MASARRRHAAAISSLALPTPLTRCTASWPRATAHLACSVAPISSMPRTTPTLPLCGQLPGWR